MVTWWLSLPTHKGDGDRFDRRARDALWSAMVIGQALIVDHTCPFDLRTLVRDLRTPVGLLAF